MKEASDRAYSDEDPMMLQLYVSGMSPKSMEAVKNIKLFCEEHLKDICELEIIDIYKYPELAAQHHIVFSPSLVKRWPLPRKTLIGTLSDTDKMVTALGISHK